MKTIKYASLINAVVSTEGSDGMMTNYIYYTVLVVYDSGVSDIVTGKLKDIAYLIPFMRTPMDELIEIKKVIKDLRQDINEIVDQRMKYVIDSLFPIPDIRFLNEVEAFDLLEKAGLSPAPEITYPDSTPHNGIIQDYKRNLADFKKVDVRIIHNPPDVIGMKAEPAIAKLKEAGFTVNVTHTVIAEFENDLVLSLSRKDEEKLIVDLEVSSSIPETSGMRFEEAAELLKENGYEVDTRNEAADMKPGTVLRWENIKGRIIRLYVSIPKKYEAKYVNVKWTNTQDSPGDAYGAVAVFNNESQELMIALSYTIASRSKHTVTGIESKGLLLEVPEQVMEPNTKGTMDIQVLFHEPFEKLPANITCTLNTYFGLMKKKDPIDLTFTFQW